MNQRRGLQELLVTARAFMFISLCSALLMIGIGTTVMIRQQTATSSFATMKGFAAEVSAAFFSDMLRMEVPAFEPSNKEKDSFSFNHITSFLVRLVTDIDPSDPHSLLAGGIPMIAGDRATLLRGGSGTDRMQAPEDNEPIVISNTGTNLGASSSTGDNKTPQDGGTIDESRQGEPSKEPTDKPSAEPSSPPVSEPTKPNQADTPETTAGHKVVFIYHSHSRESWVPVVGNSKDPSSSKKNITLVGKRLADKLAAEGIGAEHSDADYPSLISDFKWSSSYKYSRKTVQDAMKKDKDLLFFFDIHRDSQARKYTTKTINGIDYAQVYFIIGHKNSDWKENESFASKIHNALEKDYPGLSRGIWGKTSASGNGEYNQSLSPDSVLIEIGGIDNTLAESYRTADVLAKVIAQLYWDTEKVSGKLANKLKEEMTMRNLALKWAVIGGALVAVFMFGIEMTSGGIENVYGPIQGDTASSVTQYVADPAVQAHEKATTEYERALLELQKEYGIATESTTSNPPITNIGSDRLPGLPNTTKETGVNRLADTTADLLQAASTSGIHFIVGLFDSVTK